MHAFPPPKKTPFEKDQDFPFLYVCFEILVEYRSLPDRLFVLGNCHYFPYIARFLPPPKKNL